MTLIETAEAQEATEQAVLLAEQADPPAMEFAEEKDLGGPYMKLVVVTPELAAYWLTKNTHNRPVNNGVIREYALAMQEDRWQFDGDPYQIGETGEVLNAQHRLFAQVQSQRTLIVPVWFNIKTDAQLEMDQGRKRSFGSNLWLRDVRARKDSSILAPITAMSYYWDKGSRGRDLTNFGNHNGQRAQPRQLDEYWREHAEELLAAVPGAKAAHKSGFAPIRITSFANMLFRRIDVDDANAFMQALATGVGLDAENPILLLRQRLVSDYGVKNKIGRPQAWIMLALMIKAWNFWRDGESIRVLSFKPGGASKEMFPEPH